MTETTTTSSAQQTILIPHTKIQSFVIRLLESYSVSSSHAHTIASALTLADLRGVTTHGTSRLPSYLNRVRLNLISPTATPTLTRITPCTARINGNNAFGFLPSALGIDTACTMAKEYGIGLVTVHASNHFGMSAWIVQRALDQGMASLVFTNSSPALPPFGGRSKLLGVSPIAAGAPGKEGGIDFVLDMAPSVAARGKVHQAKARGESIPEGWALDGEGRDTTDPARALEGTMLPIAGPKGSALAIMMDVFSGVFSGSAFAGNVKGPFDSSGGEADVGHFFIAMRPGLFVGEEEFRERLEVLYQTVVGSDRKQGVDRIWFPGEREEVTRRERVEKGIPYTRGEIEALNAEARRAEIDMLSFDVEGQVT